MLDLSHANASALAQILAFPDAESPWGADDLGGMLRHELRSPWLIHVPEGGSSPSLDVDQPGSGGLASESSLSESSTSGGSIATLGDLIIHPHPPRALLRLAKDHTKRLANPPPTGPGEASLPIDPQVGRILYYAVLAAAIRRDDRTITTLTDRQLHAGLRWAMAQPDLDDAILHVLADADAKLDRV